MYASLTLSTHGCKICGHIVPHFGNAVIIAAKIHPKGETKMRRCLLVLYALCSLVMNVLADIAKPTTTKAKSTIDTILSIRLQGDAKEARLIIPRSQLMELRAQLDQIGGPSDTAAAFTATGIGSRLPTIVGGLFLTLAIVFGGIWFSRSRTALRQLRARQ